MINNHKNVSLVIDYYKIIIIEKQNKWKINKYFK